MQKPLFLIEPPCSGVASVLVMLLILIGVIGLISEPICISVGSDYRVPFSYFISTVVGTVSFAAAIQFFITGNIHPTGTAYIGNLSQGRASP